jgi:cytochrome c oxidase cbb3-type subunit 3
MADNKEEFATDHEYDGIRELDHPLPSWWLATFFITIIFGSLYFLHYFSGAGMTQEEELKEDMAAIEQQRKTSAGKTETDEELARLGATAGVRERGQAVFAAKCAVCHGPELQGLIGPNLTDEFWIHGQGKLTDMIAVIRKGVLDKGMPSWESQLPLVDIQAVTVFVVSRQNTHPPNPKAPQGEKVAH